MYAFCINNIMTYFLCSTTTKNSGNVLIPITNQIKTFLTLIIITTEYLTQLKCVSENCKI